MVEERHHIRGFLRNGVGGGAGEVRPAATAGVEAKEAHAWNMRREMVEVAPIPGEARQAEEGKALALVLIEKAGAVASGKMGHWNVWDRRKGELTRRRYVVAQATATGGA